MKQQDINQLKILAFLSSVRWYNILLVALAQYLSALFVFNSFPESFFLVLLDFKLHLLVLCSLLVVAGGFLINDFYDFKHDLIVRPKTTLFQQTISKDKRIRLYVWFNLLAFTLALIGSFKIFVFFFTLAFALWFYSHKLKKYPFIKEISASLLTVSCFFSVGLHYFTLSYEIFFFGIYFLMTLFTRLIIKGIEELKGDLAMDSSASLPSILGANKSRLVIQLSILFQLFYSASLFYFFFPQPWLYFILFSSIIQLAVLLWIGSFEQKEFYLLNFVYKLLIVIGIINLAFF
jgi:4-hydroxybenzoate polyprenyltransferase